MHILTRIQQRLQARGWVESSVLASSVVALLGLGVLGGFFMLNHTQQSDTPPDPVAVSRSQPVQRGDLLDGTWSYLPGARRDTKTAALVIEPRALALVQQDGSGGQANPPINLYGTYLEGVSDFTVTARLSKLAGSAAVQLYGQAPIIADEFRIDRRSLRIDLAGDKATTQWWDGEDQTPNTLPIFTRPAAGSAATVTVTRTQGILYVVVDGQTVVEFADPGLFGDGRVWFGFDAAAEPFQVDGLEATGVGGATITVSDSSTLLAVADPAGLQALAAAKRPDFAIGAAMALGPAATDPDYARVAFGKNFGALTPENAMKWQFLQPQPGVFNFAEADALVDLASRHGMRVQGHTLVFGEANPGWVRDLPAGRLEQAMLTHIQTVVGHFKGKVHSWDVINEPFDDEEWSELRPHIWQRAMGEAYIAKAFHAARAADPGALLFINDYGLEEDGDRWNEFLALVTRLKAAGVPIDGVGFQAHVYERRDKIDPAVLRKHIRQLALVGLKARVSEMDVYIEDGTAAQAAQYADVFRACLAEPTCISWTTWGVSDRYNFFIDDDGSTQQGQDFLWDHEMQPTPAVDRIRALLR